MLAALGPILDVMLASALAPQPAEGSEPSSANQPRRPGFRNRALYGDVIHAEVVANCTLIVSAAIGGESRRISSITSVVSRYCGRFRITQVVVRLALPHLRQRVAADGGPDGVLRVGGVDLVSRRLLPGLVGVYRIAISAYPQVRLTPPYPLLESVILDILGHTGRARSIPIIKIMYNPKG